jgi:hypothetical protein
VDAYYHKLQFKLQEVLQQLAMVSRLQNLAALDAAATSLLHNPEAKSLTTDALALQDHKLDAAVLDHKAAAAALDHKLAVTVLDHNQAVGALDHKAVAVDVHNQTLQLTMMAHTEATQLNQAAVVQAETKQLKTVAADVVPAQMASGQTMTKLHTLTSTM